MKNLFFIVGAAIMVSISACGKTNLGYTGGNSSGSTSNINTNNIISQWYYTTDTVNYYTGSTLDSSKAYSYFQSDYIQFNSNGSGVEMRSNVSTSFTFSITDLAVSFLFPTSTKVNAVVLQKVNTVGTRTFASSGTVVHATIKALTSTNLVLVFNTTTSSNTTTSEIAHFSN